MSEQPSKRVIVQNLSFGTSDSELRDAFAQLGEIEECVLATDANGKSRGFGFITFASAATAAKATAEEAEFELGGRVLRVQVANQRREARKPREIKAFGPKLYCGDLPWELSADELAEHFGAFGKVENAYLAEVQYAAPVNGYKPHRGFGFVEFSSEEEATKALKSAHTIKGANVRVTSAKGEEKKKREKGSNDNNAHKKRADKPVREDKPAREEKDKGKEKEKDKPADKPTEKPAEKAADKAPAPARRAGVKIPAAPTVNPWSKKSDGNGAGEAVSAAEFPSLADVASGKVKAHRKTEDEIAAEIAAERAAAAGGNGKGKEEAE